MVVLVGQAVGGPVSPDVMAHMVVPGRVAASRLAPGRCLGRGGAGGIAPPVW